MASAHAFERIYLMDWRIQVSEDGGATWRAVEAGSLPGVPRDAFVNDLEAQLLGIRSRREMGEAVAPSVARRLRVAIEGACGSTYGPTPTHRRSLDLAEQPLGTVRGELADTINVELVALEMRMDAAANPWTPGRSIPELPPEPGR